MAAALFLSCRTGGPRYNVVLISLDTLRADRVGAYQAGKVSNTPALDRLAGGSYLFENAFSTASVTTASHMSMFTGLYPPEHRLSDIISRSPRSEVMPPQLSPAIRTLPEILHEQGYKTARFVFGRDFFLDPSIGFGRGFDENFPYGMDSEVSATAIGEWLAAPRREPFFAFVHSKRAHPPFVFPAEVVARAEREGRLDPGYKGPIPALQERWNESTAAMDWSNNFIPGIMPDCFYFESLVRKNNADDRRRMNQLYDLAVQETDHLLGRVLTALEKSGRLRNTILIVVSDHGEQFLEHGTLSHIQLHQEETHVPFLVHLPEEMRAGMKHKRVGADVQTTDILPTVLDALGLMVPAYVSGRSVLPLLRGQAEKVHDAVYSFNQYSLIARSSAVRVPGWALVVGEQGERLFDRVADPREERDLSASRPEELERLKAMLKLFELRAFSFQPEAK